MRFAVAFIATFVAFNALAGGVVTLKAPGQIAGCTYQNFTLQGQDYTFNCTPVPVPPNPGTCPVVSSLKMGTLGPQYKGIEFTLAPGQIGSFLLPTNASGYVQVFQAVQTPPSDTYEVWFSKCPGDVNDPLRNQSWPSQWGGQPGKPCVKSFGYTGGPVKWNTAGGDVNVCHVPPGTYVNYRHTGPHTGLLPNMVQWN